MNVFLLGFRKHLTQAGILNKPATPTFGKCAYNRCTWSHSGVQKYSLLVLHLDIVS